MTFAENENATKMADLEAYDMTVNMRKLSVALDLKEDQMEAVAEIHHTFSAEMLFAAQASKDERKEMVKKAVMKDVKYMNYILDREQYRKYLMLLNATLNNRGLNIYE
jgi:hypothetical protein